MENNRLIRIYATSLVEKDSKILLQQEGDELTRGMWYLPSGRSERKETILDCAVRETKEETGYQVDPKYLIGIYQYDFMKGNQLVENVNFVFKSDVISGSAKISKEVLDIQWFTTEEIKKMISTNQIRNLEFVQAVLKDYQNSNKYSLDMVKYINKLSNHTR